MHVARQGRPLRLALVILGVVAALAAAAWAALVVLLPPERARELVSRQVARSLSREVRFEGVGVGLWPPVRVTVNGPALAEPGGFKAGTALRAARLHLDLDVWALLRRGVRVQRLELQDATLHLVQYADGTTNLDGIVKPEPEGAKARPMDLDVQGVTLRNLRLVLDDTRTRKRRTVRVDGDLGFRSARGRLATRGDTQLSGYAFGDDTVSVATRLNQSLAGLTLAIRHDGTYDEKTKRLALERLEVGLGKARLALTGTVDEPGPRGALDLRARGDGIDFGELLAFASAADAKLVKGIRGSGRLDFNLALRGRLGTGRLPSLAGVAQVRGASFRYPGARVPVEGLAFTARFAPDSLGIGDLRATVAGQPVQAVLIATRFADPLVRFAVRGNVDLEAVAPMLAPEGTRLSGRVALDVRGGGRARDPGSMAVDGKADLAKVRVMTPTLPQPIDDVNGRIEFAHSRAAVRGLVARAGKTSFTLDGTAARPLALMAKAGTVAPADLSFRFDSPYLDVADLLPSGKGGALPLNTKGGGTVRIKTFKNQKLEFANVVAEVALEPNRIEVPRYSLDAFRGRIGGHATFDLGDPAHPQFKVAGRCDSLSADAFLSALTPAKGLITGNVSSSFDLSGGGTEPDQIKRTLTAIGQAAVFGGHLGSPVLEEIAKATKISSMRRLFFDDTRFPFRVVRGQVFTDSVRLKSAAYGDWRMAGWVGFDGRLDYAMSGTLPPEVAERLGARAALAAGALSDEQGRVLIDLRVTGTAKSPRVTWDARAMRDRLAGKVSQALKQQSERLTQELVRRALGVPAESVATGAGGLPDVKGSLKQKADELLRDLLSGKRKPAARDTAPDTVYTKSDTLVPVAPARDTSRDSTGSRQPAR